MTVIVTATANHQAYMTFCQQDPGTDRVCYDDGGTEMVTRRAPDGKFTIVSRRDNLYPAATDQQRMNFSFPGVMTPAVASAPGANDPVNRALPQDCSIDGRLKGVPLGTAEFRRAVSTFPGHQCLSTGPKGTFLVTIDGMRPFNPAPAAPTPLAYGPAAGGAVAAIPASNSDMEAVFKMQGIFGRAGFVCHDDGVNAMAHLAGLPGVNAFGAAHREQTADWMQKGIDDFNRKVGQVGADKACATTEMDMGQTETLTSVGPVAPAPVAPPPPPAAPVSYAPPHYEHGTCYLSVAGRVVLDGACHYSIDHDGSLYVGSPGDAVFSYVNLNGDGTANASWNNGASHAHDDLGTVTRKGGCWSNAAAKICAWKPGTQPTGE
jgi:hypothetical protein